jgi:hypothetical protein
VMMVPQLLQPLSEWLLEAWEIGQGKPRRTLGIEWVPPARFIVDPAREIPALITKIQGGLASRQGVVRELGFDPDELLDEQQQDADEAKRRGLTFTSIVAPPPEPDSLPDQVARMVAAMPQVTMAAPNVNVTLPTVNVEAPDITVHTPAVKTGAVNVDVGSGGKPRGRSFEKTVTGYDTEGRIISMVEREIFDEGDA